MSIIRRALSDEEQIIANASLNEMNRLRQSPRDSSNVQTLEEFAVY